MKAILEPTDCKVFQPITITVTLETIEEAHELWHRLNICQDHIDRDYQLEWGLDKAFSDDLKELWHRLDNVLGNRDLGPWKV